MILGLSCFGSLSIVFCEVQLVFIKIKPTSFGTYTLKCLCFFLEKVEATFCISNLFIYFAHKKIFKDEIDYFTCSVVVNNPTV